MAFDGNGEGLKAREAFAGTALRSIYSVYLWPTTLIQSLPLRLPAGVRLLRKPITGMPLRCACARRDDGAMDAQAAAALPVNAMKSRRLMDRPARKRSMQANRALAERKITLGAR